MSKPTVNSGHFKGNKTTRPSTKEFQRIWYVLDASKEPMGRLATKAAELLMGKNRADYSPDVDMGGCVVIINSTQAVLTGRKSDKKIYLRRARRLGTLKGRTYKEQLELDHQKPFYLAVKRMLPKNSTLDVRMNNRLHIFADDNTASLTQKLVPAN